MTEAVDAPASRFTILQLIPESLPSFRADVTVLFAKYLPRHGVHCDIVGMPGSAALPPQGFASARRPSFSANRWRREWSFLRLCLGALLQARRGSCDLIQVRDMVPIGLLGLLVARCKGIPFAYWMSFPMSEGRIERARAEIAEGAGLRYRLVLLKGLVERALLHRVVLAGADHVFVQSAAMLAQLERQGVAAAKMTAVPMGVDMEVLAAQSPVRQRPPGWEDVPLVAYLGTLDRSRSLEVVVEALALLRKSQPQACLLLIGDSPTAADVVKLRDYAARLGLAEAIRVTGWLPSAQAWELLVGADAAISYIPRGNLFDISSPTKLLEYLALGVPCVGNDNPDQVDVLTASAAGWLAQSNAAAMAAALAAILAEPAAALARAGHGRAYIDATRSYRVLGADVARCYRSIAAGRR